jgi:cell division protein FtsQ
MAWSAAMNVPWKTRDADSEAHRPAAAGRGRAARAARAAAAKTDTVSTDAAAPGPVFTLDPRWLNALAWLLGAATLALLITVAIVWLMRAPWWSIQAIEVRGELQRLNVATLRANTMPRLNGNFFTLDLAQAQQVYASVPWVRHAVVQRVWPNRLRVTLEEHQPVARWVMPEGSERLVNHWGEVFDANQGDIDADQLPELTGPEGSSVQVLKMRMALDKAFEPLGKRVVTLAQSGRGSWSAVLSGGAEIELGRGSDDEVLARAQRFAGTVSQVIGSFKAPLLSADLRHTGGYAVRLKGVTTIESAASAGRP